MARLKHLLYVLFHFFHLRAVRTYRRLTKKPITRGDCDVAIEEDPLWNHIIKNDEPLLDLIRNECNSGDLLMSFQEAANLIWATRSTNHIIGEIAKDGSYSGASANLILSCEPGDVRTINLFDTFRGIPEITQDMDNVKIGEFSGLHLDQVKSKLIKHANRLWFHVGFFPDTSKSMDPNVTFSLVNLDADTYQTTFAALQYFYPRMARGGFIICHDYSSIGCPEVRIAIDKFFSDKRETIIPLWHTQALIIAS